MRDLGILVWVALLIVGVIGSMVSTVRRQAQSRSPAAPRPVPQAAAPPQPPQRTQRIATAPAPPPAPARPPRPAPRPAPAPVERPVPHEPTAAVERRQKRLFPGKNDIVRAVVASEVLGKPRGLNDEYFGR